MNSGTESKRQQKIGSQIVRDMADILTKEGAHLVQGSLVSVTLVRMSPDLSVAKVYLSVFPFDKGRTQVDLFRENSWLLRKALGTRVKNQLRIVPELIFYLDDSLEYAAHIDKLIKQ